MASLISPETFDLVLGQGKGQAIYDRCFEKGDCTIYDFITTLVAISQWLLGLLGVIALFFFILGGIYMMLGGAKQDYRTKGKEILKNSVIAIIIIFSSWLIVKLVLGRILGIDPCLQPDAKFEECAKNLKNKNIKAGN